MPAPAYAGSENDPFALAEARKVAYAWMEAAVLADRDHANLVEGLHEHDAMWVDEPPVVVS